MSAAAGANAIESYATRISFDQSEREKKNFTFLKVVS
jgi:hypothetical protein